MAQLITVKLARFGGEPWGFRLQGGKDFAQPLCIQKVNGGSPAEKAGLQAGDALMKLNDATELYSMRHKEAQDAIVRAGNSFEITIQRGGGTWKPLVQPVGNIPKPQMNNAAPAPITKTSLAATKPAAAPIGSAHNNMARPFGAPQMNGSGGGGHVPSVVNKQYNTPVAMYSEENIAETLSAQAEVLAGGVLGVNFKKNERTYQPNNSEVLRMVQEVDLGPREAEPEGYYNIGTKLYCDVHAKMAARQQPPGPNLEPLTVPPGQRAPPGAISAALAHAATAPGVQSPAPMVAPSVTSPPAANMAPLPFHQPTPPSSAPISSAPKPFFAPPPPTVSSAAMNKPAGGPKFVWPPPKPEDENPMITGPTATPIYFNPMEPTPMERNPPQQPFVVSAGPPQQSAPAPAAPAPPPPKPITAHVNAPGPYTPAPKEQGPPVHPPMMQLRPNVSTERPVSPMVFALTTAPDQAFNLGMGPGVQGQAKGTSLAAQQQTQLPNFQPSFDVPPQPYQHQQFQAPKPIHPVQPPRVLPSPQPMQAPTPVAAPLPPPSLPQQSAPSFAPQQIAPPFAPQSAPSFAPQQSAPSFAPQQFAPSFAPQQSAPSFAPPQQSAPSFLPQQFAPAPPCVRDVPVMVEPRPAPAQPAPRPISPLPALQSIPSKQTFPPPAPMHMQRPTSPLPSLAPIPAKQTFPPPAPMLSKALSSALAAAPKIPPPAAVTAPDPAPGAGAAAGAGNPKGGSVAGLAAPRRGRGVLTAPVTGGARVPVCGMCQGQIRGPFITAMGKTWCPDHFICVNSQCQRHLQDCGFVEEKGDLYCEFCFEQFLAPGCDKCRKKIKGDCLNAIGKHFHPECFVCAYCSKLFGNNPFFLEDGLPYCEADWNELFTTKCFACGFPIEAGDRWVEALNNNYHSQCFNCTMCKKNLEGQSFFAKQGRPFCKTHAR